MNQNNCNYSLQPDIDVLAKWPGFGYRDQKNRPWESIARVRIWRNKTPIIVVFSDLDSEDTGTSITNSSEYLATLVKLHYQLSEPICWFEHYPRHNHTEEQKRFYKLTEDITQVLYCTKNDYYYHPRWKHIDLNQARKMIGHSLSMNGELDLPVVKLVTPYEQQRIDFEEGKNDAAIGLSPRSNTSKAYQQGYNYGHQLSWSKN